MGCARGTLFRPITGVPGRFHYLRPSCKRLGCEHCGPGRAAAYRKAIARICVERKLSRFLTLTLDPKKFPPGTDTTAYIRECWNKFRVYCERQYHRPVQFISILEYQKNGNAHLHVMIDQYMAQPWISEQWQAVGGGWKVWIEQVDVHSIPKYLSKYLSKSMGQTCPKHRRKITTSRHIRLWEVKPKTDWRWNPAPFWMYEAWAGQTVIEAQLDSQGMRSFLADLNPDDPLSAGMGTFSRGAP